MGINDILIILLVGMTIFTVLLMKAIKRKNNLIKQQKEELEITRDRAISTEGNHILKKILELSFEKDTIVNSSKKIVMVLREFYNIDYCTIFLFARSKLETLASNIEQEYAGYMEVHANRILNNMSENEAIIQCSDQYLLYPTAKQRNIKYMHFVPLKVKNSLIGGILLEDMDREKLERYGTDLFEIIIEYITIALLNLVYYDKLVSSAMIDGLTQVYNRAYLTKRLGEEIDKHRASNMHFTLAVLDVDFFKKVNDTYGHLAGDMVLKTVAAFIKNGIRSEVDFIARYGGEEFVIIFTKSVVSDVNGRIDSLREQLSQLEIDTGEGKKINITASFGVSQYPDHGDSMEKLIHAADQALYYAKEHGRNQVVLYENIKNNGKKVEHD